MAKPERATRLRMPVLPQSYAQSLQLYRRIIQGIRIL
jgi:hypothetical protein